MKRNYLTLLIVLASSLFIAGTAHAGINDGLVAYYPFNGNANDASGNGNHGTVHGAALTEDRFGNQESAYSFDGVNDKIVVPDDGSFNVGKELTISLWIRFLKDPGCKTTSFVSKSVFFNIGPNTGYVFPYLSHSRCSAFGLLVHTGRWDFDRSFSFSDITAPYDWHFYASTYKDGSRKVYIDGKLVADDKQKYIYNNTITANNNDLTIGTQPGTNEWANAEMDDIRIYNRALSAAEIQELHSEYVIYPSDLVGWWPFDEGNGTFVTDVSGTGNHGHLSGNISYKQDTARGSVLNFNPSGAVIIPHHSSLEPPVGAISVWLKIDRFQNSDVIMKTTNLFVRSNVWGGFSVIGLRITEDGKVIGLVGNDGIIPEGSWSPWTFAVSPAGVLTLNEWHHVAMQWDGCTVAVFVDGTLQGKTPYDPVPGTGLSYHNGSSLRVGFPTVWGYPIQDFVGQLDDLKFWSLKTPGMCPPENTPPVADAGPDQTVECASLDGTQVTLDGAGSTDPDDDELTYAWTWDGGGAEGVSPTVTLPYGTTTVTLTVSDGEYEDSDEVDITVRDTTPPSTSAILEGVMGQNGWYVSDVDVELAAVDTCTGVEEMHYAINGAETAVSGATANFTLKEDGEYAVTYGAVDNAGNEATTSVTLNIDKTAPVADISLSPGILWPPNHKMVDVAVNGGSSDPTSGVASVEFTVADEYGTVEPEVGGFNTSISLEAWRNGGDRDGRRYSITAVITDNAGNKTTVTTEAVVPHDMRGKK